MFPTFSAYTERHPRIVALLGVVFFSITALVWWCPQFTNQQIIEEVAIPQQTVSFDPRTLLTAPDETNQDAVAQYNERVATQAIESDTITIGQNCTMDPMILRMKEDSILTIENKDSIAHIIAFENGGQFVLSPNYPKEINLTEMFDQTEGIHRYRCDDISTTENVGVLYIVK